MVATPDIADVHMEQCCHQLGMGRCAQDVPLGQANVLACIRKVRVALARLQPADYEPCKGLSLVRVAGRVADRDEDEDYSDCDNLYRFESNLFLITCISSSISA